ncbi:hypothetical protein pb186bvf_001146 [Paramecium bursaria]
MDQQFPEKNEVKLKEKEQPIIYAKKTNHDDSAQSGIIWLIGIRAISEGKRIQEVENLKMSTENFKREFFKIFKSGLLQLNKYLSKDPNSIQIINKIIEDTLIMSIKSIKFRGKGDLDFLEFKQDLIKIITLLTYVNNGIYMRDEVNKFLNDDKLYNRFLNRLNILNMILLGDAVGLSNALQGRHTYFYDFAKLEIKNPFETNKQQIHYQSPEGKQKSPQEEKHVEKDGLKKIASTTNPQQEIYIENLLFIFFQF